MRGGGGKELKFGEEKKQNRKKFNQLSSFKEFRGIKILFSKEKSPNFVHGGEKHWNFIPQKGGDFFLNKVRILLESIPKMELVRWCSYCT